ncbi:hypothetical protein EJ06DRAFT_529649 [Trichodelitschia bisporula]|uniref:N-acetyltransferase domain-containing protein n=1 Tax=Trichodelitschia bisporula TaxID=703511 RepID=A0A6G1I0A1_9PEZI|nr:hypothetical protein EJ06DRAFT_529649 [Trichodelitschia bisporula]
MTRRPCRTFALPRQCASAPAWTALIDKFRAFRLEALRTSPTAFTSSLEREQAFGRDVWEERLRNPGATIVVAVEEGVETDAVDAALQSEWLGMAALIAAQDGAAAWLNGVFVTPAARHRGVGSALLKGCLREGSALRAGLLYQVMVSADNVAAIKLYEKAGFVICDDESESLRMERVAEC